MTTNSSLRVTVLGAGGFLGSALAQQLAFDGHQVTAYDRQPNIALADLPNVTTVVGDLRDEWSLAESLTDTDVAYHFASVTHPSMFYFNPAAEYCEALQPLLSLMEIAARVGTRKIVFPSSGGTIYAASDTSRTEQSLTDPRSPYAIFKLTSEQLLHHAARQGQFSVDVYRICNPYGPGQRPRPGQGVVAHWANAIKNGEPIKIFGDGSSIRDYVYVDDVCRLMSLSCQRLDDSDTFNLGSGVGTSLNQLADIIQRCAQTELEIVHLPGRRSDIHSIVLSPAKLLALTPGFEFTSLDAGIRATLREHGIDPGDFANS